ncbi:NUDIX hydrolase [Kineosporia babensis]
MHSAIISLVAALAPLDELGRAHRATALAWLASTPDIFRRAKPRTPSPHLVAYFLLVDRSAGSVLLCDHRLAGLWLPTGGHVEPDEHPYDTVRREIVEELGVSAEPDPVLGDKPFLVTVTETKDAPERRHTDVSLWFALRGQEGQHLQPDEREFVQVRWWPETEIRTADPHSFDPHLGRALDVLALRP